MQISQQPGRNEAADAAAEREEERALVARVRASDASAYEAIFRQYWESLYNCAFRYVRSAEDAEDVVQSVMGRVWSGRADWRLAGSLGAYLHSAVRNACLDRIRRDVVSRRFRERRIDEILHGDDQGAPE